MFGAEWLRSLGMVPSEYLYYFYFASETVAALGERPRGAYLVEQQAGFYAATGDSPEQALARWRAAKDERDRTYMAEARDGHEGASHAEDEPGGYEAEALAVVEAIAARRRRRADPQRGQPLGAAVPGRARRGRGAVRRRRPPACGRSPSARCPTMRARWSRP